MLRRVGCRTIHTFKHTHIYMCMLHVTCIYVYLVWAAGTDPAAFEEGMRQLVARARPVTRFGLPLPGAFALNKLRIGEVLLDVTSLVRTHRVKVDLDCSRAATSLPSVARVLTLVPKRARLRGKVAAERPPAYLTRAVGLNRWSPTSQTS